MNMFALLGMNAILRCWPFATPTITGDGVRSITRLMIADPPVAPLTNHYKTPLPADRLDHVPASGERVVLGTVASLRVDGRYENAMRLNIPDLEQKVEAIAHSMNGCHFGRLDGRFSSEDALNRREFKIIELNGAGSEASEFRDPTLSLWRPIAASSPNRKPCSSWRPKCVMPATSQSASLLSFAHATAIEIDTPIPPSS